MKRIFTLFLICLSTIAFSQSTTVVISQVYGGGGSATGTYNADYVELHNISNVTQDISGYQIMYGSATGNLASTASNAFVFPAGVTIPSGGYLLVATVAGTGLAPLPVTADQTFTLTISGTNGKVAFGTAAMVANTTYALQPAGAVIDFVGYGTANESETAPVAVLSATTAAIRNNNGCVETNNNSLDFTVSAPAPRNAASAVFVCGSSTTPFLNASVLSNFGAVTVLTSSAAQTTNISGSNLTGAPGNITATSSAADFQVSADNLSWGSTANIPYATSTLAATPLYVRFSPQTIGLKTGTISIDGGGIAAPITLQVTGNGTTATPLSPDHLVISQIFTAGGNSGALLNADYVELHNRSSNAVSLSGHSIQYSSATSTGNWSGKSLLPAASIPAGGYYLIQMSTAGTVGAALPTPDYLASPLINMGQTAGRIALVSDTVNLYACPNTFNVVDLVGYGTTTVCSETAAAPALDTLNAGFRNNNGCDDTDNNSADFSIATPAPRNSSSPVNLCSSTQPVISASALANFGNVVILTASSSQTMTISGTNLTGAPGNITVTAPGTDFQVSLDNINWSSSVAVPYSSVTLAATSVYVRFIPQTAGALSGNIALSGGGATTVNVAVSGTGVTSAPPMLMVGTVADFGNISVLTSSASQSFSLSGMDLTGAPGVISITSPGADFEVSADNSTWGSSATVPYSSATLSSTPVYVRFSPQTAGFKSGNISITGGGVTTAVTVAVSGTGISGSITGHLMISQVFGAGGNVGSNWNADYVELHNSSNVAQSLSGLSIQYGSATSTTWSGISALPASTIPPGGYFLIQMSSASATVGAALPTPDYISVPTISMSGKQAKVALVNGTSALTACPSVGQVIDVVGYGVTLCFETAPTDTLGSIRAAFRNNNGCDDTDNNLADFTIASPAPRNSATSPYLCVPAGPSITCSPLASFGAVCTNAIAGPNTFSITGSTLNAGNITVAPLNGYSYATAAGGPYSASLSLTTAGGSFAQTIYVRFNPLAPGNYNGNITVDGGGISAPVQVAASGSAASTVPLVVIAGAATGLTNTAATLPGTITSQGCTPITGYGVEYSTTAGFSPGTGTAVAGTNLASGSFSVTLGSLQPGTTYYFITYATNAGGTVYSAITSFSTVALTPVLNATVLTAFGSVCPGQSDGPNPFTLTGSNLTAANITVGPLTGFTFATAAGGPFTASLTLTPSSGSLTQTVYVTFSPVSAGTYSGNIPVSGGGVASYAVAVTASSVSIPPVVVTGGADVYSSREADLYGSLTNSGCGTVTEQGIEYSGINGFVNGFGTRVPATSISGQDFTVSLTGLAPNTTYYYKAYAKNSSGTGYGSQESFATPALPGGLAIYGNPITRGGILHYSYYPVKSGHYTVKIINSIGQLVYKRDLVIQVDFIDDMFHVPSRLGTGLYILQIDNYEFRHRRPFMIR